MSVRRHENGTIVLEGVCAVEDAETLLQHLQADPSPACDWSQCRALHTAVVQVLLAARPAVVGPCGDPWVERWIGSSLQRSAI